MITTLKPSFNEGKTKFVEKEEKYYIELTFDEMEKKKTSIIQFTKYELKILWLNQMIKLIQLKMNVIVYQKKLKN